MSCWAEHTALSSGLQFQLRNMDRPSGREWLNRSRTVLTLHFTLSLTEKFLVAIVECLHILWAILLLLSSCPPADSSYCSRFNRSDESERPLMLISKIIANKLSFRSNIVWQQINSTLELIPSYCCCCLDDLVLSGVTSIHGPNRKSHSASEVSEAVSTQAINANIDQVYANIKWLVSIHEH